MRRVCPNIIIALALLVQLQAGQIDMSQPLSDVDEFIEPEFPFVSAALDIPNSQAANPARNLAVRGRVIRLADDAWACFDSDLLRMAAMWRGGIKKLRGMAHTSYQVPGKKASSGQNRLSSLEGTVWISTGLNSGWSTGDSDFQDSRPIGEDPNEIGRGPLPNELGRWNGLYVSGDRVALSYEIHKTPIYELPELLKRGTDEAFARTFHLAGERKSDLSLLIGEISDPADFVLDDNSIQILRKQDSGLVTAIGIVNPPNGARLNVSDGKRIFARIPTSESPALFRVVIWRGKAAALSQFRQFMTERVSMPEFTNGSPNRWKKSVSTTGVLAREKEAYVVDEIGLPFPNPWHRNVRPASLAFFDDGRAAVCTFEGDVWIVSGLGRDLSHVRWQRYASGFGESMGIAVRDGQVFVYSREGITRLHDLNGNGEADYYENFCDLPIQSGETREFPMDMKLRPDGGFYLAKGGIHDTGRAAQNGTILSVSPDGRSCEVVAHGLREPFIGYDPETNLLTASDQQGNEVPASPIYAVRPGNYFGFHWAAHGSTNEIQRPITWMPHFVDNSAASQISIHSDQMGPLSGSTIHLSYGRPALFHLMVQKVTGGSESVLQGGVVEIPAPLKHPILQGRVNPVDGQFYLCGFQIYGSNAQNLSGLSRLRYTGQPDLLPTHLASFRQGVMLRFNTELNAELSAGLDSFIIQRWNYRRTLKYGSPHYRLNGEPGQDDVGLSGAFISRDGRGLFLRIPDMREVMQMAVHYQLRSKEWAEMKHSVYLTVNALPKFDSEAAGFDSIDLDGDLETIVHASRNDRTIATLERGHQLYQTMGCMACHSTDGAILGKTGPTWKGLYGSIRKLAGGKTAVADEDYLRESITNPDAKKLDGYEAGMPSYLGILNEIDVESLILLITSIE